MALVSKISGRLRVVLRRHLSSYKNVLTSTVPDIVIPETSVQEYVFENVSKWSQKTAVECGITGKKYTYDEIATKSTNLNKALRKSLQLSRNDVIAVLLPNIPEFPIVILGGLKAGLTVTTINPMYTADEISNQLQDSSPKVVFTLPELVNNVKKAAKLCERNLLVVAIKIHPSDSIPNEAINFGDLIDSKYDIPDVPSWKAADIAFLLYSSGTTGLPKAVELTHQNVVANLAQASEPTFDLLEGATENFQEVVPAFIPMYHIYGLAIALLRTFVRGGKVVSIPKFTSADCISVFHRYRPTVLYAAPPLLIFLTTHDGVSSKHLDSLKKVMCGAAPLAASDELKFLNKINGATQVIQGYGLTECSPVISMLPNDAEQKYQDKCAGSIGHPLPNIALKIVPVDQPEGEPLGPNMQGEIFVKGPNVMQGYRNRPEDNAKVFQEGWLRTGDIAYYDDNKLLYITDRMKDLIKVKGFQVAPAELEGVIRSFTGVSDAAVIGISHERYGEVPRAYVVPSDGKKIDLDKLYEYVSSKVAKYKQLVGGIVVVDNIPKNPSGKILRKQLKLEYVEKGK